MKKKMTIFTRCIYGFKPNSQKQSWTVWNKGFENNAVWQPRLYDWQQKAANVLFFTFIHPVTMDVPPAFEDLAKTRGTGVEGAIPSDTVILFAIGK